MKDKIRFLHVSDVHLGANPYQLKERFDDMGKVFREFVSYATNNDIDFVVIVGDLFDKKNLNAKTLDLCIDILKPLIDKKVPIYVTEGNHDQRTYSNNYSWLEFMNDNGYITLLNPIRNSELEMDDLIEYKQREEYDNKYVGSYVEDDDKIIYGLGFPGILPEKYINHLTDEYLEGKENKIVISLLHTGIDHFVTEEMGGAKLDSIIELSNKSDYIALGHIHNLYVKEDSKIYNPGSLENTTIPLKVLDKGFFDVTIDKNTKDVKCNFVKVNNRKVYNIQVDITGCNDPNEAYNAVIKHVDGIFKTDNIKENDKPIMNIKICGALNDGTSNLDINELREELKSKFNILYIELQNQLRRHRLSDDYDEENLSRDDIDKLVIKDLLKEKGFDDSEQDYLLNVVLELKNLSLNGDIDLSTKEGNDIKDELLKFVRDKELKNENENKENVEE